FPRPRMNEHEAAAAQVAGFRPGHRQGESHGDCSIDRIAAPAKDLHPDFRRRTRDRDHHAVAGLATSTTRICFPTTPWSAQTQKPGECAQRKQERVTHGLPTASPKGAK